MITFKDEKEKIDFLKQYKLMPKTFTEIPTFYYFEIGSDTPVECEVVGHDDIYDNWATITIKVKDKYINIHSDYLLEMKNRGKAYFNNLKDIDTPDTYVVIDLETTGTNNKHDKIIEIAALKVTPTTIYEFSRLVYIDDIIPINITLLTGITNDMLSGADPIEVVLPEFLKFIGNCNLVGHNIKSFDIHFINRACEKLHLPTPTNTLIDTLHIARTKLPDLENHKLSTICQYYGVDTTNAHRGLKDCYMCNECYKQLSTADDNIIPIEISNSNLEAGSLWYNVLSLLNAMINSLELPPKGLILKDNAGTKTITRSICINEPPYPATPQDLENYQNIQSITKIEENEDSVIISIKESCLEHVSLPPNTQTKTSKSNKASFVNISFSKDDANIYKVLEDVIRYRVKTYSSSANSFGCCSQFEKCSDAKKCVHENKLYSTACQYRRHLENGRIFYGKNRNID